MLPDTRRKLPPRCARGGATSPGGLRGRAQPTSPQEGLRSKPHSSPRIIDASGSLAGEPPGMKDEDEGVSEGAPCVFDPFSDPSGESEGTACLGPPPAMRHGLSVRCVVVSSGASNSDDASAGGCCGGACPSEAPLSRHASASRVTTDASTASFLAAATVGLPGVDGSGGEAAGGTPFDTSPVTIDASSASCVAAAVGMLEEHASGGAAAG